MNWVIFFAIVAAADRTSEVEDEIQACRKKLSANRITVYTDGPQYIMTNLLPSKLPVGRHVRGTARIKMSAKELQDTAICMHPFEVPVEEAEQPFFRTASLKLVFWLGIGLGVISFVCGFIICWAWLRWNQFRMFDYAPLINA